ncbi:MAG: PAS domain S-box protein [Actinomycetota bacterium]|nr:PAS domain S-box protein [Actinomycetota bacterium]
MTKLEDVTIIALEEELLRYKKALKSLTEQLSPIFDGSIEGVFIYLDSEHKSCNKRLADMFGYTPLQWSELYPFEHFFTEKSKDEIMVSYYERIIAEKAPIEMRFTGVKKNGSTFNARLLMVPISYKNLIFALGFVELV